MRKSIIKMISIVLSLLILITALCACNVNVETGEKTYNDGVIGEKKGDIWGEVSDALGGLSPIKYSGAYAIAEKASDGAYEPTATPGYVERNGYQISAGTLTAGELKDSKNIDEWLELCSGELKEYITKRGLYTNNIIIVTVKNSNGDSSIFNQTVELCLASDNSVIYKAKTDINGEASLYFDKKYESSEKYVKVNNEKKTVTQASSVDFNINAKSQNIKELDLMLMIDTTGSMSDELEYIKVELADMVTRVNQSNEALSIRVSVNFYRDEGDDYIVKYFDFRENVEECVKQISEQSANGGGDYPEAVHTALDNAISGHEWRENAVKICFFVLDAPPHTESEIQGINSQIVKSLTLASEKGIKVIPVASSGVDKDTEFILRSFALMTGGTYIFLTNHSGIGNPHIEPSVDDYTVEPLNECMIRVVCEYCGLEYTPKYKYDENDFSKLRIGTYCSEEENMVNQKSITLNSNGSCSIVFSMLKSYIVIGDFSYEDGYLTIYTSENIQNKDELEEITLTFKYESGKLIYMRDKSSVDEYHNFKDGDTFVFQYDIYDRVDYVLD